MRILLDFDTRDMDPDAIPIFMTIVEMFCVGLDYDLVINTCDSIVRDYCLKNPDYYALGVQEFITSAVMPLHLFLSRYPPLLDEVDDFVMCGYESIGELTFIIIEEVT